MHIRLTPFRKSRQLTLRILEPPFLKGIVYQDSGRGDLYRNGGLTSGALQNGVHIANDRKKKNWVRVSGTVTANGGNGKWENFWSCVVTVCTSMLTLFKIWDA